MILYIINFPCLAHPNDMVYSLVLKLKALVLMNWFICSYIWQRSSYLFHLVINFSSEQWEVHMNWSPCSISANLFDIKRERGEANQVAHSFVLFMQIWVFFKDTNLTQEERYWFGSVIQVYKFWTNFWCFPIAMEISWGGRYTILFCIRNYRKMKIVWGEKLE